MNIALVDNNTDELSAIAREVSRMFPNHTIKPFSDPLMSAKYICNNEVELVFFAATMRPVDGFVLLKVLRANKPSLPMVMLLDSASQQDAAIGAGADGAVIKSALTEWLQGAVCNGLFAKSAG